MYSRQILNYSEKTSTLLFHLVSMVNSFFPIVGAILADGYFGKCSTLFLCCIMSTLGYAIMTVSTTIKSLEMCRFSSMIALAVISVAGGMGRPNFVAFCGEQFIMPQHEAHMNKFFSIIYIIINTVSCIVMLLMPALRQDVSCMGKTTCYTLPFGLCTVGFSIAICALGIGKRYYRTLAAEGAVLIKVWNCIWYSLFHRISGKKGKREFWLQYADDKYDPELIRDTYLALHVLLMFLPFPVYFALHNQMDSYAMVPTVGEAHLRVFNGYICPIILKFKDRPPQSLAGLGMWKNLQLVATGDEELIVDIALDISCPPMQQSTWNGPLQFSEQKVVSYFITYNADGNEVIVEKTAPNDDVSKSLDGTAIVRILCKWWSSKDPISLKFVDRNGNGKVQESLSSGSMLAGPWNIPHGSYQVLLNNSKLIDVHLEIGGVYMLVGQEQKNAGSYGSELHVMTKPSNVHLLWQIPQSIAITVGEVMLHIAVMQFSYSQAPRAMKSVIQTAWILCMCMGNVIIMIVTELDMFRKPAHSYFMYSALMTVDMIIFTVLAVKYTYVVSEDNEN